jgi:hypothetical protein
MPIVMLKSLVFAGQADAQEESQRNRKKHTRKEAR